MTNEQRAKVIASKANECCNRSDGFEEEIYNLALHHIQEAYREGYRDADKNPRRPDYTGC